MESLRLWTWKRRMKLLLSATVMDAFLVILLDGGLEALRDAALRAGCHRTGKRGRQVAAPLYRLRSALSRLWQAAPPSFRPHR